MTVFHLISASAVVTAFLISSIAEITISHYVPEANRQNMVTLIVVRTALILLGAVAFVYDVSDFDQGSIDWFAPLLFACLYLLLCVLSTREVLKPHPAFSRLKAE